MEKYLRAMLDFQKFDDNADMRQVIDTVHARYAMGTGSSGIRELTTDEMAWLAAAGTPDRTDKKH